MCTIDLIVDNNGHEISKISDRTNSIINMSRVFLCNPPPPFPTRSLSLELNNEAIYLSSLVKTIEKEIYYHMVNSVDTSHLSLAQHWISRRVLCMNYFLYTYIHTISIRYWGRQCVPSHLLFFSTRFHVNCYMNRERARERQKREYVFWHDMLLACFLSVFQSIDYALWNIDWAVNTSYLYLTRIS
jgi:hypothetical protein